MGIKKNPLIPIPEGMLHEGEIVLPLNRESKKGCLLSSCYYVSNECRYFTTNSGVFEEKPAYDNGEGQPEVMVYSDKGQQHLIVTRGALATFKPVENMYDMKVVHNDCDVTNNHIDNLSWGTSADVVKMTAVGPNFVPRSRNITDDDIRLILKYAREGKSDEWISETMAELGVKVSPDTVRNIRSGHHMYGVILERLREQPVVARQHTELSANVKEQLMEDVRNGATKEEISEKYGIAIRTARRYIDKHKKALKEAEEAAEQPEQNV